jgi:hypothetical protein
MPDLQREGGVRFLLVLNKWRIGAAEIQRHKVGDETRRGGFGRCSSAERKRAGPEGK